MNLKHGYANIYLLKYIIDDAIKNDAKLILHLNRRRGKRWQNNHELLIRNYELMKKSRKRIIEQRNKLQKQVNYYKQREKEAQPILDCKREVQRLLHTLTHKNGEISKLERENRYLRTTNKRLEDTIEYNMERFLKLKEIINQKEE